MIIQSHKRCTVTRRKIKELFKLPGDCFVAFLGWLVHVDKIYCLLVHYYSHKRVKIAVGGEASFEVVFEMSVQASLSTKQTCQTTPRAVNEDRRVGAPPKI
jgi:hypothetical protein